MTHSSSALPSSSDLRTVGVCFTHINWVSHCLQRPCHSYCYVPEELFNSHQTPVVTVDRQCRPAALQGMAMTAGPAELHQRGPSPEPPWCYQGQAGMVMGLTQTLWPPHHQVTECRLSICRFLTNSLRNTAKIHLFYLAQLETWLVWSSCYSQVSYTLGAIHCSLGVMWEELSLVRIVSTLNEAEYLCLVYLKVSHQLTSFSVPNNVNYIYTTSHHWKGSSVSLQTPVPPLGVND